MTQRIIRRKIFMGDSLSDRATLDHLSLLDCIPMSLVSGLAGKSPRGRFTNGFLWIDMLGATGCEQLEIDHWRHILKLVDTPTDNADLLDRLLSSPQMVQQNQKAYTLDDDKNILYKGARYIRSYCEGGATSSDWRGRITASLGAEGARLVVADLATKRKQLLTDDFKYKVSALEKAETLVTEWTGANDLITVNDKPSKEAADEAVNARIANIEALINSGYRNFVLMNLPDLGLTPRYQGKTAEERANATLCATYFNTQLAEKAKKLQKKYQDKDLFIDVFDVCALLTKVHNSPEQYGFDKDKLKTPYTSSAEFKENESDPANQAKHISASKGYMFWDDVHPTAEMHSWLAEQYMEQYEKHFSYKSPVAKTPKASKHINEAMNQVKNKYGLDVATELNHKEHHYRALAAPEYQIIIDNLIEKISTQYHYLEKRSNQIAKDKGAALHSLVDKINHACSQQDLAALNEILNAGADNILFGVHRNPRWDKFWKKETTRSEDELRALQIAVNEALNLPFAPEHSKP